MHMTVLVEKTKLDIDVQSLQETLYVFIWLCHFIGPCVPIVFLYVYDIKSEY